MSKLCICILTLALTAFSMPLLAADPVPSGEEKLREALRNSMIQLRSAQADLASLQAAQAAAADEKKSLSDKFEVLRRQVVADRVANGKSAAAIGAQLAEQRGENAHLKEALEKERAESAKNALSIRELDATATRLKNEKIFLERKVADLQAKNLALFLAGNEILSRYADFSLGNAISAKEPFVSLTRTKLENLVQDYQDQLLDQRAKP